MHVVQAEWTSQSWPRTTPGRALWWRGVGPGAHYLTLFIGSKDIMRYAGVILAGRTPSERDELLEYTQARRKALIRIQGKEMVRYVTEALVDSGRIARLIIVGLEEDRVSDLDVDVPVTFVPNQDSLLGNLAAAIEELGPTRRAVFSSSDIPLLSPEAVRDFVDRCEASDADLCYAIVERSVMEDRFPGSGRSFRPLKDGHFAGGDLALVKPEAVTRAMEYVETFSSTRKSGLHTARAVGLGLAARFLFRRLSLEYAEKKAEELLQCTCKAIISPFAEIGMDVDKVHQYHLVRSMLENSAA